MGKKIISFAGVKREDLIYYVAKMLATCDMPVLVVDNSYQNALFRSVWVGEGSPDAYVRNITFIKNALYDEQLIADYEWVIVYHGDMINSDWWNVSDDRYLIVNFERFDMEDMAKTIKPNTMENINVVFTARYSNKVPDKAILTGMGIAPDIVQNAFEITTEEDIERMRISLQYNGIVRLNRLPASMKKVIWGIYKLAMQERANKQKMNDVIKQAN